MRKQELHPRTAVLNKTQKNHSKKARYEALTWLATQFPKAFDNTQRISPLKNGIMEDILIHAEAAAEVGISKSKLREAVVLFTRRLDYLICLKARNSRIDLQGQISGEVTEEEAEHAASKVKKRIEKSSKNAHKLIAEKTKSSAPSVHTTYRNPRELEKSDEAPGNFLPIYPLRSSSNSMQSSTSQAPKSAAVLVKHKATRQYDPSAVAKLKEKLGLSRAAEEKKEQVE